MLDCASGEHPTESYERGVQVRRSDERRGHSMAQEPYPVL